MALFCLSKRTYSIQLSLIKRMENIGFGLMLLCFLSSLTLPSCRWLDFISVSTLSGYNNVYFLEIYTFACTIFPWRYASHLRLSSLNYSLFFTDGRWDPTVLIEGVLFRARYLGSTQLVCEGQPTKTTRMMQAEEAVSRIKVSEYYCPYFNIVMWK